MRTLSVIQLKSDNNQKYDVEHINAYDFINDNIYNKYMKAPFFKPRFGLRFTPDFVERLKTLERCFVPHTTFESTSLHQTYIFTSFRSDRK